MQLAPTDSLPLERFLPQSFFVAVRRQGVRPSRFALAASVASQRMALFEQHPETHEYRFRRNFLISTSRCGISQQAGSNGTPLGLHRIARKCGGGHPVGTVFQGRRSIGLTWQGVPEGDIVHRILWLEGLEPGFNRGGNVDSFKRFVYIHGFWDETSLGRPKSIGCIHMSATDLMPLYERLPVGTLVWIGER